MLKDAVMTFIYNKIILRRSERKFLQFLVAIDDFETQIEIMMHSVTTQFELKINTNIIKANGLFTFSNTE
jgi:hypothetical protein